MKTIALGVFLLAVSLLTLPVFAQSEANEITSDNVEQLTSIYTYDYADVPEDVLPGSGLFAVDASGERIVSFGRYAEQPPSSLAILWGYADTPRVNRIDDGSILRFLSPDGMCLYAGYRGYYQVYQLQPDAEAAQVVFTSNDFGNDTVNFMWLGDEPTEDTICNLDVYAEVMNNVGRSYIVDPQQNIIVNELFVQQDDDVRMARIGRINPPEALTVTLDGTLFFWDMPNNEIVNSVNIGQLSTYGAMNRAATHYVYMSETYTQLYFIDFAENEPTLLAEVNAYISHLDISNDGTVMLGVDPEDAPGTVSAWLIPSGERIELGPYRVCDRIQPDMVELTADGTTLVIGCDAGLDVWRVAARD